VLGLNADTLASYAVSGVTALIVIIAGLIASSWVSSTLRRVGERSELDPTLSRFFSKMARHDEPASGDAARRHCGKE
jgi:hypothetical protein